ncbi:MAG TPA: phosphoenolpyruvate hydrolase family protein [Planctomycetota bacterium]|nr:phosphoenolpyruvate hydrolase family protein [Planctomycetota bacterium]
MNRGKILDVWRGKIEAGATVKGGPGGPDYVLVTNRDKLGPKAAPEISALLPIGDANGLALAAAKDRVWGPVPVIAGVCATDPLRMMENFLQEMKAAGIVGVQNSPSVGMIDGSFRKTLEETQFGYDREVRMIGLAVKLDLLSIALAFGPEDARKMAEAGADVVVAHPGLEEPRLRAKRTAEIVAAARSASKDVLVFGIGAEAEGLDGIQSE